ncbi:MAG: outer membrane protein assembly factor BamE [Kangiellaceae bacterium]|jgi:outer membrane protein assembly factor BamE|nr:outer membrane protein assembly factor BamE [Kangiellaceae bacterium]
MVKLNLSLVVVMLLSLSGCGIYKMNIRQGNIVEQKFVDQLKPGMSKQQVEFLLGRPVVNDTFDDQTWYYLNNFRNGKTAEVTQVETVLYFKRNKLYKVTSDLDIPAGLTGESAESSATQQAEANEVPQNNQTNL